MSALLTPDEAAQRLGCEVATINEKLNRHELPGVKYGRGWMLPEAAFLEYLNDQARQHVRAPKPRDSANDDVRATHVPPKKRAPPKLVDVRGVQG